MKFVRFAQSLIDHVGVGIVGYITNNSYINGTWYRGMRNHLIQAFSDIRISDLHGGKGFVRSVSDDDENVFDILQGVCVAFFTRAFHGVPEEVWNIQIGGYQVCEKWLKDRKGRTLTADDITHYHRIVIALHETIRLMREIDEVIEAHGGWPGAFTARSE